MNRGTEEWKKGYADFALAERTGVFFTGSLRPSVRVGGLLDRTRRADTPFLCCGKQNWTGKSYTALPAFRPDLPVLLLGRLSLGTRRHWLRTSPPLLPNGRSTIMSSEVSARNPELVAGAAPAKFVNEGMD